MADDLKSIFNNQLPNDSWNKLNNNQLPIAVVDKIADELVAEFKNPLFRRWYCGVIRDFGPSQVQDWRRRASEGGEPGKLFSSYVREARVYRKPRWSSERTDTR